MKKEILITPYQLIARLILGGVFLYTGLTKAFLPQAELVAMFDAYGLFSLEISRLLASLLPWLEIYIGLFSLLGLWTRWVSLLNTGVLMSFIGFLGWVLYKKIVVDSCGCFGGSLKFSPNQTIWLDAGLLLLSVGLFFASQKTVRYSLDAWCEQKEK